ncbi:MAG: hypothetical protein AVDCRST_MAG77-2353 [uncultured Chloroflexi bacterium]|uniref:Recombinase domain-containing protein n=1 Tax=uncultured Chloroflexota bacterium TaxID=166587 RepID=A0A6J4IN37_9CHLR|nr:MAG: hypothetical protein AVDCRST_MAG77-2353 [uncultured Chloroflexota bacterium]
MTRPQSRGQRLNKLSLYKSRGGSSGVRVEFVTESLDDSPEGQLVRYVRGYAAKVEHEKIRERSIRGRRQRALSGKLIPVGRSLYGYTYCRENGVYLINPLEAPTAQRIFALAAMGWSTRKITAQFLNEGVPAPSGSRWYSRVIHMILKNPRYTGRAVAWLTRTEKNKVTGKRMNVPRPPEEQVPLPEGTIPRLVDDATFAAVQERFRLNKERAVRNNRNPEASLLRGGYARCGHCKGVVQVRAKTSKDRWDGLRYDYFCCRSSEPGHEHRDCRSSMSAPLLDAIVWNTVARILKEPTLIEAEVERMSQQEPRDMAGETADIDDAVADIIRQQRNLAGRLAKITGAAGDLITEQINALDEKREQLLRRRQTLAAQSERVEHTRSQLRDLQEWCGSVAAKVDSFTYSEKRLALDALGVRVQVWRSVHDPRFEITARIPINAPIALSAA